MGMRVILVCGFLAACAGTRTAEYADYPGASTEPRPAPAVPEEGQKQSFVLDIAVGLVWIQLAEKDLGLEVGDVLQLRRGASYVGQVAVTQCKGNLAGGVFDTRYRGPGAPPRIGDTAARNTGLLDCGTGERTAAAEQPPAGVSHDG